MAISVDWETKVISIPKADTLLLQTMPTEIRELNLNTFRLTLKDLEDDEAGITFLMTHNHYPPVSVGGVTLARVIELINGYTVTFEDGQYAVNLAGANSNVGDVTNVNQVSVRSANSAGLIQTREIEYASFQNAVWIDQANGVALTAYPAGTPTLPVNNAIDAQAIAALRGFRTFRIVGLFTTLGTEVQSSGAMLGSNLNNDRITVTPGTTIIGAQFEKLWIKGNVIGGTFQECFVEDCMTLLGGAKDSGFLGSFSFLNAEPHAFQFFDCHVVQSANPIATLNFIPTCTVLMHRCSGKWLLRNITTGTHILNMLGAEIELDSSCTGGTVIIRGNTHVIDNSAGTTVDTSGLINLNLEKVLRLAKTIFARQD